MNGMTRRERQVTDMNEIIRILDTAKVLHLGLVDGDEPYVVPMNYGYIMENEKLIIYLHGAPRGRKIDLIRSKNVREIKVCVYRDFEKYRGSSTVYIYPGMDYAEIEKVILAGYESAKNVKNPFGNTPPNGKPCPTEWAIGAIWICRTSPITTII